MRILFLCGSLEAGKDGVGDYTRRLSAECGRRDHTCSILAVNDPHIAHPEETNADGVSMLRLPERTGWRERSETARSRVEQFGPDWISIQFVSYGYQQKGVVSFLIRHFERICGAWPRHIMFHELWLGSARGAGLRERIVGSLQRRSIMAFVRRLDPEVVHTSIDFYSRLLERNGITAKTLPLFGNVPIAEANADGWLFERLQERVPISAATRAEYLLVGAFGSLYSSERSDMLLDSIVLTGERLGRRPVIVAIGAWRQPPGLWKRWSERYHGRIEFVHLGFLPEDKVGEVFNSMEYGLATTPLEGLGKSSAAVSMIEHGLPVLACEHGITPADIDGEMVIPDGVIRVDDSVTQLPETARRRMRGSRLPEVAAAFLGDLGIVDPGGRQ